MFEGGATVYETVRKSFELNILGSWQHLDRITPMIRGCGIADLIWIQPTAETWPNLSKTSCDEQTAWERVDRGSEQKISCIFRFTTILVAEPKS